MTHRLTCWLLALGSLSNGKVMIAHLNSTLEIPSQLYRYLKYMDDNSEVELLRSYCSALPTVFFTHIYADEGGQVELKRYWIKFANEWRCADVYSRKTEKFFSLLTAEVIQAPMAPTLKKRPVSWRKCIYPRGGKYSRADILNFHIP